jgi:hypothetical protein
VLAFVSHASVIAYYFTFLAILNQLIIVYGFNADQASYICSSFQITGIAGGVLSTLILHRVGPSYFKIASLVIISLTIVSKH